MAKWFYAKDTDREIKDPDQLEMLESLAAKYYRDRKNPRIKVFRDAVDALFDSANKDPRSPETYVADMQALYDRFIGPLFLEPLPVAAAHSNGAAASRAASPAPRASSSPLPGPASRQPTPAPASRQPRAASPAPRASSSPSPGPASRQPTPAPASPQPRTASASPQPSPPRDVEPEDLAQQVIDLSLSDDEEAGQVIDLSLSDDEEAGHVIDLSLSDDEEAGQVTDLSLSDDEEDDQEAEAARQRKLQRLQRSLAFCNPGVRMSVAIPEH